ncbi:ubiquitin carboxyl-terminal hydrolase 5/13 [Nematocida major]|uniref:ubiquitin carboxyl-terminal hydrolase 5/13 n=1 Tax=Nematocida major TaxID=1912982 RepID=UPI002008586D|nr:ubiquitin carboxyl-terminal hydrolase 5/13 [Nematocida major]KAH9387229.1 ubiquitin carboxyl-terminal hydrolase 5/13 [Nematocida major]
MFSCMNFTGECTFCYRNTEDEPILYCSCGTEMCSSHSDMHHHPGHAVISVSVAGSMPDISIEIEDFGNTVDKDLIISQVRQALLSPKIEGGELQKCEHVSYEDALAVDTSVCSECEIDSNTWLCTKCNVLFCGREQYGVEGKGHGMKHYSENAEHCVFVKVQSIDDVRKTCDAYCYKCDSMVSNGLYGKIKSTLPKKDSPALNTLEVSKRMNTKVENLHLGSETALIPYTVVWKTGGMTDLGNTCYISSVLQSIAYCLRENMHRLDPVYETNCEGPKDCFGCQFAKVIRQIDASHRQKVESFSVERLCTIVQSVYPRYVLGTQQDASEYFTDLVELIGNYDEMGHFSDVSGVFKIKQDMLIVCDSCGMSKKQGESAPIVYIGSEQTIDSLFMEEDLPVTCSCGEKKKKRANIVEPPAVFSVGIKRGLTEGEGARAPLESRFTVKDFQKKERVYRLLAAIVHRGTAHAGHYIAQIPLEECASDLKGRVYSEYQKCAEASQKTLSEDEKAGKKKIVSKKNACVIYDNEKTGVDALFVEDTTVLFYRLCSE